MGLSISGAPVRSNIGAMQQNFVSTKESPEPLPEGCTAVQYLESKSDAYINTGIRMSPTCGFFITFTSHNHTGAYNHYICGGYRMSSVNFCLQYQWSNSGKNCNIYVRTKNSNLVARFMGTVSSQTHTVVADQTQGVWYDGEMVYDGAFTGITDISEAQRPFFGIFQVLYQNGNTYGGVSPVACQIHHAMLFDGDEVLFDGIPVRYGDIGCMYDRVSGELFFNAGTGEFGVGPDK